MKQIFKKLSMSLVFMVMVFSFTPALAQSELTTLANVMPSNMTFYVEVASNDIPGTLDTAYELFPSLAYSIGATPEDMFQAMDAQMSQVFGQEFSLEDDILPLLGDSIAIGYDVNLDYLQNEYYQPDFIGQAVHADLLFVAAITDQDSVIGLIDAVLQQPSQNFEVLPRVDEDLNGESMSSFSISVRTPEGRTTLVVAVTADYLIMGTRSSVDHSIDVMRGDSDSLLTNDEFVGTMTTLESSSLARVFVDGSLIRDLSESNGASQEWLTILGGLNSIGMAIYADDTQLAIEYVHDLDFSSVRQLLLNLPEFDINPITFDIANQLPERTASLAMWSDPAGIYEFVREAVPALAPLIAPIMYDTTEEEYIQETRQAFVDFEDAVQDQLGLDLEEDVLPWATGEMASFIYHNPQSDLRCTYSGVWEFDQGFLLNVPDSGMAAAAVSTFSDTVDFYESNPVQVSDNIYEIDYGFNRSLMYGMIDNSLVITNGSALPHIEASVTGNAPSLADNPVWVYANSNYPTDGRMPVLFANLVEFEAALRALEVSNPFYESYIELLAPFESASLFIDQPGNGIFHLTGQVLFRRPDVEALPSLPEPAPLSMDSPPEPTYEDDVAIIEPTVTNCSSRYGGYSSNSTYVADQTSLFRVESDNFYNYSELYLWDVLTGETLMEVDLDGVSISSYSMRLNGNQARLYSGAGSVIDLETGNVIFTVPASEDDWRSWSIVMNHEGNLLGRLLSRGDNQDGIIRFEIWDVESGELVTDYEHTYNRNAYPNMYLTDSSDTFIVATVGDDTRQIQIFNADTQSFDDLFETDYYSYSNPVISPDRDTIAIQTASGTFSLISLETGESLSTISGQNDIVFSPNSQLIATILPSRNTSIINIYQVNTGELVAELSLDGWNRNITFGRDSRVLVADTYEYVSLWHLPEDILGE